MKRFRTIFSAMVLSFAFVAFLSSCSDDDKDTPEVPAANNVAGVYEGDMTCSVMGQESTFEDMTFTLSVIDDATVKIVISEFGNPPMNVPSINIDGVKVSGEDGKYSLAPTNFSGNIDGKAYSGVAQGTFENEKLTVEFNLQYGAMPMPMICSFTAPKK